MSHYYVYAHLRPDGSVFYIGKGSGRRAWEGYRGSHWVTCAKNINYNFAVKILFRNLTNDEARIKEARTIKRYEPAGNNHGSHEYRHREMIEGCSPIMVERFAAREAFDTAFRNLYHANKRGEKLKPYLPAIYEAFRYYYLLGTFGVCWGYQFLDALETGNKKMIDGLLYRYKWPNPNYDLDEYDEKSAQIVNFPNEQRT